ncbi:hypothetical protein BC477_00740 [Clavibacter michiganensis subsp. michiganensis]|uniref:Uncharacterized protein n=1 Tax=Clavibacter michiganensis subsp. michiganensis TaxID=33013 RepID=A0A251XFR6_CLAMM|nr:hypothetical protein BC477_00740 [Clavibacter michiganensis subsp. michiganensis]OUE00898.1 hypothetical protein CMMCAS07_15780 [Clavibacter michiganensis subsp. michiganensis]
MRVDGGSLALDGDDSAGVAVRVAERVALVDTPRINEPADDVTLRAVVAEELALAGHRSGRHEVGVILDDQGLADLARAPFSAVPAVARIRLLTTLAASRDGVEAVVVTSPERHGGAVAAWMRVLRDLARSGTGVLVVTSEAAAEAVAALDSPTPRTTERRPDETHPPGARRADAPHRHHHVQGRARRARAGARALRRPVPLANQDPYSSLDKVPAALVVADQGATVDGKPVDYGTDVAKDVLDDASFDWHEVSSAEARTGLEDGTYDFTLTIPSGFSAALSSSSGTDPQQARVVMATDDANSYLATTIAQQAGARITKSVASRVGTEAAGKLLLGLADVRSSLGDAASGAQQLVDGTATARSGADALADGNGKLATGADALSSGLGQLRTGTAQLPAQTQQLATGADQVASGAATLSSGATELSTGAASLARARRRRRTARGRWRTGTRRSRPSDPAPRTASTSWPDGSRRSAPRSSSACRTPGSPSPTSTPPSRSSTCSAPTSREPRPGPTA